MLVKKKIKNKHLVIGRGYCTCKQKSYVYGKGVMDFVTNTIIPNIHKISEIGKVGNEVYGVAKHIKNIISDVKEINKDYKEDVDLIRDVKAGTTLSILKKLKELKKGKGFQII